MYRLALDSQVKNAQFFVHSPLRTGHPSTSQFRYDAHTPQIGRQEIMNEKATKQDLATYPSWQFEIAPDCKSQRSITVICTFK